jgi:hypothetical protein
MRRVFGALFIAFLVLAVAVTPLLATFRPASFDLIYSESPSSLMRVTLEDQTGLVMGFNSQPQLAESPGGSPTRSLVVSWAGGCINPDIYMQLIPSGDGYLLVERTSGDYCEQQTLVERTFSIALRAPIDPATVEIVHE